MTKQIVREEILESFKNNSGTKGIVGDKND